MSHDLINWLLPPSPLSSTNTYTNDVSDDARNARFILIDPQAGTSNRMLALASGVALAIITNRTPIVLKWNSMFGGDRFGSSPPKSLLQWSDLNLTDAPHVPPSCHLSLQHVQPDRPCWSELINSVVSSSSPLDECQILSIKSNQYFLPLLLSKQIHGRRLRDWFYPKSPMTVLSASLFQPPPHLMSAVEAYHSSLVGPDIGSDSPVTVTLHVRTQILGMQEYGRRREHKEAVNLKIAECAVKWVASVSFFNVQIV